MDKWMDKWRVRATLMKEKGGKYYIKLEVRSEMAPTNISFVNVDMNRTQNEIENRVQYAASMLAEHQNANLGDIHDVNVIAKEMLAAFHKMMAEIAESGMEL